MTKKFLHGDLWIILDYLVRVQNRHVCFTASSLKTTHDYFGFTVVVTKEFYSLYSFQSVFIEKTMWD